MVAAQTTANGAAARLAASHPDLFPAGTVADATLAGVAGAQVSSTSEHQRALGVQEGDVIIAVDGQVLTAEAPSAPAVGEHVFTVLRHMPGERPVLAPEILGRQVLEQFSALPAAERSPVRLTRMVANQQMLVQEGVGLFLVPAVANQDDTVWLTRANPLPLPWEAAVRTVRDAILTRAKLPESSESDADAAARLLGEKQYLEAGEHAQRALFAQVAEPEARADRPRFDPLLALYLEAQAGQEGVRHQLLAPGARFAIVVEPLFSSSATPLPQDILLQVERSNDFLFAAGLNTSLHWPSPNGGWPVLRDLDLLLEYGYTSRRYEGPFGPDEITPPGADVEPPVTERMAATEHRLSFELTYRPTLLARFRPMLRGGPAFFISTAHSFDQFGTQTMQVDLQSWGWIAGAGIDLYRHSRGMRATLVGTYQSVKHEFCDDDAASWERASNIPDFKIDEILRDACPQGTFGYKLDMSAWQAGVQLAFEF